MAYDDSLMAQAQKQKQPGILGRVAKTALGTVVNPLATAAYPLASFADAARQSAANAAGVKLDDPNVLGDAVGNIREAASDAQGSLATPLANVAAKVLGGTVAQPAPTAPTPVVRASDTFAGPPGSITQSYAMQPSDMKPQPLATQAEQAKAAPVASDFGYTPPSQSQGLADNRMAAATERATGNDAAGNPVFNTTGQPQAFINSGGGRGDLQDTLASEAKFAAVRGNSRRAGALATLAQQQQFAPQEQDNRSALALSQVAENRARAGLTGAQTMATTAKTPAEVQSLQAQAGRTQAETGEIGAKTGLTQAETTIKGQQAQGGAMDLITQRHLADLRQRALSGDKGAADAFAIYQKAQAGKGGPISDEDVLKVYGDMVSRASSLGPDAYKQLPNFNEFYQSMKGGGNVTAPANHIAALKANPSLAASFDQKYGAGAAKQALGN